MSAKYVTFPDDKSNTEGGSNAYHTLDEHRITVASGTGPGPVLALPHHTVTTARRSSTVIDAYHSSNLGVDKDSLGGGLALAEVSYATLLSPFPSLRLRAPVYVCVRCCHEKSACFRCR